MKYDNIGIKNIYWKLKLFTSVKKPTLSQNIWLIFFRLKTSQFLFDLNNIYFWSYIQYYLTT